MTRILVRILPRASISEVGQMLPNDRAVQTWDMLDMIGDDSVEALVGDMEYQIL